MKREIEFFAIQDHEIPLGYNVIFNVTSNRPGGEISYISTGRREESGILDKVGDPYMHADDITHWAHFPNPITALDVSNHLTSKV